MAVKMTLERSEVHRGVARVAEVVVVTLEKPSRCRAFYMYWRGQRKIEQIVCIPFARARRSPPRDSAWRLSSRVWSMKAVLEQAKFKLK